jgi:hypothetical protein
MIYLIYLICSVPIIWYLETRPEESFVKIAFLGLNIVDKTVLYAMPLIKEIYFIIDLLEKWRPEWFKIKNDI